MSLPGGQTLASRVEGRNDDHSATAAHCPLDRRIGYICQFRHRTATNTSHQYNIVVPACVTHRHGEHALQKFNYSIFGKQR